METKIKTNSILHSLDEKQVKFMENVVHTFCVPVGKGDIMKMAFENTNGIDSAIPIDYVRNIQEIHPNFKTMFHAYSYQEARYGEMVNVAEQFIIKLNQTLRER